jgi:hypothetical protein
VIVLALAGAVGGALVVAVRRGRTRPGRDLDPDSTPPQGVRVFDIAGSSTPQEITNIFWEHASRDATQDPPEAAAREEPERGPDTKPMVSPPRWPEAPRRPAPSRKSTGEHED